MPSINVATVVARVFTAASASAAACVALSAASAAWLAASVAALAAAVASVLADTATSSAVTEVAASALLRPAVKNEAIGLPVTATVAAVAAVPATVHVSDKLPENGAYVKSVATPAARVIVSPAPNAIDDGADAFDAGLALVKSAPGE